MPVAWNNFQDRVYGWARHCFGIPDVNMRNLRSARFLEKALELAQACGTSKEDALTLVNYVYERKAGTPWQEMGGTLLTLAILATREGIDLIAAGEAELQRAWENTERIRAKNASKPIQGPLPVDLSRLAPISQEHPNE